MASNVGSRAFQNARLQKKLKKQAETLLPTAMTAYRAGRHAEAQSLCRQLLQDLPTYFDAMHLLGVSVIECGQFEEGRQILERVVALDPGSADANSNLGFALINLKRYDEARALLEKAVKLRPNSQTAQRNLAIALLRLELAEPAIAAFTRAIELKPDDADAWCNRGVAELMVRRWDAAAVSAERALALAPRHFEGWVNKGLAHLELRHFELAEAAFNTAIEIRPDMAEVRAHRGRLHILAGRIDQAEADFDAAVAREPTLKLGWQGKAQISMLRGNVAQAIVACRRVLEQDNSSEVGLTLLGACLGRLGDTAGAIAHFDRAIAIRPDYDEAITKKIFYQDFLSQADFAAQQATRRYWWDTVGSKFPRRKLGARALDPDRRIIVGYVSADFRRHSAGFAFLPVLRCHDKTKVQINCYSSSNVRDQFTLAFESLADVWVNANNLSDDELADRIQADGVDILVDLSGHTTGNRMAVFARKPAPIQVTAWGSGTGTGVATMDYFFADPVTVPQEVRHLFTEAVYDLPSVITIDPITDATPSALPMLSNGHLTFGVFNRIDKISDEALAVWSRLLREVEGAKIVIKHVALDETFLRDALVDRFVAQGIAQDRIACFGSSPRSDHLRALQTIDISLDPFPQNGGISTWESLYMGVPVVAKLGRGAASRAAGGILTAIGLDDWVAGDDDGYISIAKHFASQPAHLAQLRAELPARIARSAAGNVAVYTQHVEAGYRQFWREYCATGA
ncbi:MULTISPECIES: tetratricopeptide repeat protein [unclassified Bradyrhizobium]|uniref:O-linked N-acetylglucosamine transferase family protein n=1 Tax=unclassified Bradyrhizobium TaxID=2631580 RepID=UPI0028E8FD8F|nr:MULTISPECIES: tetratricopeptide repeat protein [unclassified Bradyrhizobium]